MMVLQQSSVRIDISLKGMLDASIVINGAWSMFSITTSTTIGMVVMLDHYV